MNLTTIDLKKDILKMSYVAGAGHIASSLSMIDYLHILFKEKYIDLVEDKIVIGKPFGAQAYYVVFSDLNVFDRKELWNFGKTGHFLTHGISANFPGIDFAEETLASCLGVACGMALSLKNKESSKKVYVNISDASLQAGTVWEAAMFASTHKLNNIVMTVDYNKQQILCDTMGMENLAEKFESFGWHVIQRNGHIEYEIRQAYNMAFDDEYPTAMFRIDKPTVILFDTIKGKDVSFMEKNRDWHYKMLTKELYLKAIKENTKREV